ncbi:hypothetical protein SAM23877_p078 (plasmid) [Streptomyces ambofaciens ATCC 23877]|uniref:Uncharacterized protein n=2 Tax=Streptomyces ambofaciens TaxID=1889 RepID=A0A0K2B6T3_STRA7|nr:hypothetical protein SAM23877_p078 [Streptomyces ambofaciens ATCC 23877]
MTAPGGTTPVPEDMVSDICEDCLVGVPSDWVRLVDRDAEVWWSTGRSYDGDSVLLPSAGDMPMMLRRDVERLHGPLLAEGYGLTEVER